MYKNITSYILNQVALMNLVDLKILSDVGLGLDDERKNFKKLLNKIMSGKSIVFLFSTRIS